MTKFTLESKESGFTSFRANGENHQTVALSYLEDGLSFLLYALSGTSKENLESSDEETLASAKAYLQKALACLEEDSLEELRAFEPRPPRGERQPRGE